MQTNIFHKAKEKLSIIFNRKRRVKKPKHYTEKDITNTATGYTTISPSYYQQFVTKRKSQGEKP